MTVDHAAEQSRSHAVRAGRIAPVTCGACGCRLEAVGPESEPAWFHFGRLGGRDARGHVVSCIDAAHDVEGHAALAA
jgi:hypothetical protein